MGNEVNFLFNTEHYYSQPLSLSVIHEENNMIYKSNDILVYGKNNFEVLINDNGLVSIRALIYGNYKEIIKEIIEEYKSITRMYNGFTLGSFFKVVVSKNQLKNELIKEFSDLNFECNVSNTKSGYTLRVKRALI